MIEQTDPDLELLLGKLPEAIRAELRQHDLRNLIEVIMDEGRIPEARFTNDITVTLGTDTIGNHTLQQLSASLAFGDDNRAGINSTLHRISAIRDRNQTIVGLTCRVGRAIYGTSDIIRDIVTEGKSILVLGPPGAGKTTLLRDIARTLASELRRRVIIVDTSNEIAGDGTIPHAAVGRSRRMQVPNSTKQHLVMIEAVENHMPQIVVIDEIGHSGDVAAARTIAERGVQLIATAHGKTIENIIDNPMLADLLGGVQTVTLSDEEAKKRGCRKTVLERKYEPTFDVVVEIQAIGVVAIHTNTKVSVDQYLLGYRLRPETRTTVNATGEIEISKQAEPAARDSESIPMQPIDDAPRSVVLYTFGLGSRKVDDLLKELGVAFNRTHNQAEANLIVSLRKNESRFAHLATNKKKTILLAKSNTKAAIAEVLAKRFCSSG